MKRSTFLAWIGALIGIHPLSSDGGAVVRDYLCPEPDGSATVRADASLSAEVLAERERCAAIALRRLRCEYIGGPDPARDKSVNDMCAGLIYEGIMDGEHEVYGHTADEDQKRYAESFRGRLA
jgi:hypothetical protein